MPWLCGWAAPPLVAGARADHHPVADGALMRCPGTEGPQRQARHPHEADGWYLQHALLNQQCLMGSAVKGTIPQFVGASGRTHM